MCFFYPTIAYTIAVAPRGCRWAISEDFCGCHNWSDPDIEWVGIGDAVHVPECTRWPPENHVAPMSATPQGGDPALQ